MNQKDNNKKHYVEDGPENEDLKELRLVLDPDILIAYHNVMDL